MTGFAFMGDLEEILSDDLGDYDAEVRRRFGFEESWKGSTRTSRGVLLISVDGTPFRVGNPRDLSRRACCGKRK